jgi:anhydro-N-acetylmuramic acid kinase
MSGTSVDGIDAALVKVSGKGPSTRLHLVSFSTYPYPKGYRECVLDNSLPGRGSVDTISQLNILSAHFFADAVKQLARKSRVHVTEIDLVGSHGQTIHHIPQPKKLFGKSIRSTLQVGDPATIAKLTGIPTVGDFRTGDMAVGGEGAPLVPYLDFVLFRSSTKNRLLLNLGGIANVSVLPKHCSPDDVTAFDTGPANMLIDALMTKFFRRAYDHRGKIAKSGHVIDSLLDWMMTHPYLSLRPPKSTGREIFGDDYLRQIIRRVRRNRPSDIIATATEFTASSVFDQYERFIRKRCPADEVIVSGGGVHNRALMESLARHFHTVPVKTAEKYGISSDAKEAMLIALLANETINEQPANMPGVTGARRSVILGKICL